MAGNSHNLVELTKKQQEQALARFEQIRPYFEEGVSQAELARMHHVPRPSLQRWVQHYRKEGLAGLARKERVDAGQSHGLPEELVHLIERHHNDRFKSLMDQFQPQWRHHRDELNRQPLRHEHWSY